MKSTKVSLFIVSLLLIAACSGSALLRQSAQHAVREQALPGETTQEHVPNTDSEVERINGMFYESWCDYAQAREHYDQALRYDPQNTSARLLRDQLDARKVNDAYCTSLSTTESLSR